MSKSPARWDPEKLKWMNGEYLRRVPDAELALQLEREKPEVYKAAAAVMNVPAMIAAGKPKFQLLSDLERFVMTMAQPSHPDDAAREHLNDAGRAALRDVRPRLAAVREWTAPNVSAALKDAVKSLGVKMPQVMMPFRAALTGLAQTPDIASIAAALERDVALERLDKAAAG